MTDRRYVQVECKACDGEGWSAHVCDFCGQHRKAINLELARKKVDEALQEWWAQGCKELP